MTLEFGTNIEAAAKIADRASSDIVAHAGGRMAFIMGLCAADGVNGNLPLDLDALAAADEFNFVHDVCGIVRHLNRKTGALEDCFVPRFARNAEAA